MYILETISRLHSAIQVALLTSEYWSFASPHDTDNMSLKEQVLVQFFNQCYIEEPSQCSSLNSVVQDGAAVCLGSHFQCLNDIKRRLHPSSLPPLSSEIIRLRNSPQCTTDG